MSSIAFGNEPRRATIRPIKPEDDSAIARIVRTSLAEHGLDIPGTAYFDPELDHLSAFYREAPKARAYFVMQDCEGRIIGGAGLAEFPALPACCELQKIYLVDEAQGTGLGSALLQAVENEARMLGYRRIYLETHHNLRQAIRFYKRHGYELVKQPVPSPHPTMDHFFLKNL